MAGVVSKIELPKDEILLSNGDDVENLYLLIKGKITVYATYENYTLTPGTVVALSGSNFGISTYTYVAAEDCVLQSFPCHSAADVLKICETYAKDFPRFVLNNHRFVGELLRTYLSLMIQCRKKDPEFALDERINRWELDKYNAIASLDASISNSYFGANTALATAALVEASRFATVMNDACLTMADYLGIDKDYVAPPPKPVEVPLVLDDVAINEESGFDDNAILQELSSSLSQILSYSGWDDEDKTEYEGLVAALRATTDHMSPNEETKKVRHALTSRFYRLYYAVFKNSLKGDNLPNAVRLFLYFGFIDTELAGATNAIDLYKLSQNVEELCSSAHVCTIYHWLKKIYFNEKQPSKNGFDQSYDEYIQLEFRDGRMKGNLSQMLNNQEEKLRFEIENMFRQAHYMTHGRVSTFLPIMISDYVLRPLKESLVTAPILNEITDRVRNIDYSLFYRSRVYTNTELKIGKELVYAEVLPDIILMPCVGSNGVMWQEIEGRNRSSSARIMLPIFCSTNIESVLINAYGRYRWEMCKRIQGAYWNNISEPSLTSEYCDYLQFYKKNRDLTDTMKQKIRSTLTNCRNNYNEYFAREYENWILYESKGNGKLNKVSRQIISKYCPFSKAIRDELKSNPMFTSYMEYTDRHNANKRHHLDNIIQALSAKKINAPREIVETRQFFMR